MISIVHPPLPRRRTLAHAFLVLLASASAVWGGTRVEYSAPNGLALIAGAGGTALPAGNVVRIGRFDDSFDLSTNLTDLLALQAAWTQYGSTTIGANVSGAAGRFDVFSVSADASFDGEKAYLWIFKTTNNSTPTPDYSNVEGYGLFSGGAWFFPVLGSLPTESTLTVNTGTTSRGVTEAWHGDIESDKIKLRALGSGGGLSFSEWAADDTVFSPATSAADRTSTANPDHDELTNDSEFFHGLPPQMADVSPLTGSTAEEGGRFFFDLRFPRRKGLTGAQHHVEISPNMLTWQAATPVTENLAEIDALREEVHLRIEIIDPAIRFARLVIVIAP